MDINHERSERGGIGKQGRDSASEKTIREAPEGDCQGWRREAVEFVYFIESENQKYIKIGISTSPIRRLTEVRLRWPQFGISSLMEFLPANSRTEYWLHHKFAEIRHIDEWFESTEPLRVFISNLGLSLPEITRSLTITEFARMGGKARAQKMTKAQRSESARKAVKARWAKTKRRTKKAA